ncbi:MAG: diacylglycerol kinase family protein [Flavitalea sp.]
MQRKLVYLVNPISGTKGKAALKEMIAKKTQAHHLAFEILATNKEGNYDHLRKKIESDGITDVIVCGGDGTVSAVAGSLLNTSVAVGIIPMGSGNGLALTARIPVAASKALDIIFAGKSGWIDGFYINDRFSCMLAGLGFDAQVAKDFDSVKRRGLQTYLKICAINYFKAKAHPFEIISKKKKISTEAFFLSIANSNQFGNHFTIAPHASLTDGLLDIVIAKKMNKLMLPFSILHQFTGINAIQTLDDHIDRKNVLYFQTTGLVILNPGLAPLHVDGEPMPPASRIEVKIMPNAFRLLQPF